MSGSILEQVVSSIAGGGVRLVDLTETLREEYATIQLPPEFGQALPFKKELISRYDENGPAWYWHNFSMSEHTGTHFDAPIHWVTGAKLKDNSVDTMPLQDMIAPVCVVDCSEQVKNDLGFLLTPDVLLAWEAEYGKIEAGSWLFMRTDWRKVADPENYTNMQEDGGHSPGPTTETVEWLIHERDVHGFGTECVGTDAGQAFAFEPAYPCHTLMHGAGKYGLQCMTNLDQLPAKGAVVLSTPLKIEDGSGSPLRVVALVPDSA